MPSNLHLFPGAPRNPRILSILIARVLHTLLLKFPVSVPRPSRSPPHHLSPPPSSNSQLSLVNQLGSNIDQGSTYPPLVDHFPFFHRKQGGGFNYNYYHLHADLGAGTVTRVSGNKFPPLLRSKEIEALTLCNYFSPE